MMSVAKPLVFALMCGVHTPSTVAEFVGLNATGQRFNSVSAIEDRPDGRTNPMVNPGRWPLPAGLPGGNTEEKWRFLQEGLPPFAGRELSIARGNDLAVMAATLASGGVNPSTGVQVVDQVSCRCAPVVMATAGLYETSGEWL